MKTEPIHQHPTITLAGLALVMPDIEEMAAAGRSVYEGRFDWDDFLLCVERDLDIDLPTQMDDPIIRKIQRAARAAYAEAQV